MQTNIVTESRSVAKSAKGGGKYELQKCMETAGGDALYLDLIVAPQAYMQESKLIESHSYFI